MIGKSKPRGNCCRVHEQTFRWQKLDDFTHFYSRKVLFYSLAGFLPDFATALAVGLGDLEASLTYVQEGLAATAAQGFNLWQSEAHEVFQHLQRTWPDEQRVKEVAERFHMGETSL